MGKQQPAPPPPTQQTSSLEIPPAPALDPQSLAIARRADAVNMGPRKKSDDPDIERVLAEIDKRQEATAEEIKNLTPGSMAFKLMRQIPRDKWNTPLTEMGHYPRGSSVAEIRANPKLKNFTPAQAMLKLFEMDDEQKAKK